MSGRLLAALLVLAGCSSPVVKQAAFDPDVLAQQPLPASKLRDEAHREKALEPGVAWMAVDTSKDLVFAGYRDPSRPEGGPRETYCLVLACRPEHDELALLPLGPGETPLGALARPERVDALRRAVRDHAAGTLDSEAAFTVSLGAVVAHQLLGPPLPTPGRILAVAANFPSHLQHDLDMDPASFAAIAATRPRVFQKHPAYPVPGTVPGTASYEAEFDGVIGPFDGLKYPARILLPRDEANESQMVDTVLDYEVEIGVVIGRSLDAEAVQQATDEELLRAVAGYVLVSDVKARNPQLFQGVRAREREGPLDGTPYLTGVADVDEVLGDWNPRTCAWWSYAASQGDYASIGPFFVAAPDDGAMPPRAMVCARTYGTVDERGVAGPAGREPGVFYLRQCSRASNEPGHRDAMLWTVPQILRSVLAHDSVLRLGEEQRLDPGDVISLGTPGGVVLTVRDRGWYKFLDFVLFWWDALDWHDAFFAKDEELYLRDGDEVFLWAEGLGFQRQRVVTRDVTPR